ncbi:ATP-binding cassette domain-containing protein [Sulfurospirillum sp. UCH001]|uniref:ATP-binding cassette domain-containing protein n=1 Tax=Sulfurospirillum sp. UCH001 TaxID=1581011 RepID=UPI0008358189|nr:ATP-binding cassette domain-containing protein [Sulfurospirillum sp. UCH001]
MKSTTPIESRSNEKDTLLLAFKYILDFYYGNVSFETIERILGHENENISIDDIRHGASDFGLHFDEVELGSDVIDSHLFPAIVVSKQGDVNIVTILEDRGMVIIDPSSSQQESITFEALKERFELFLSFYKELGYKNILTQDDKSKAWFWQHLLNAKPDIIRVGVLTLFINLFIILVPMYAMNVYNRVIPNFAVETLFVLSIGIVLIFLFDALFKMARVYILESMGKKIGTLLEEETLKRILLIQSGHDHLLAGSKANLFREVTQIRDFFMSKSIAMALDLPFVFLTLLVIYLISPSIAVMTFVCALVVIGINLAFQVAIFGWSKKLFHDGQMKHNFLFETIKGIETLKLNNAITKRLFKWRQLVNFYNFVNLKIQMHSNVAMNLSAIVMQLATVLTLVIGVYEIQDKNLTIGALVALGILVSRAMIPVVNISTILMKYKEFKEALESINRFWHLPLETQKSIEIGVQTLEGEIEFNNVTYTYAGSKNPSLFNATFKIKAGEKVGFIGRTGAGKSTILRLLSGLDTPQTGTVHIDGHEINTLHPVELRSHIGIMPQEPFLFAGTLKDNIEIGINIGKERLIKLLKMTGLDELVKRSGEGENFQVGENGNRLSVGQRHLVGLARALINDPSIVILDEPTTGMDIGLEKEMVDHLKPMLRTKTLLVITHRFAALELVDRVIVVNNGRLVADGPKDEILRQLQGKQP